MTPEIKYMTRALQLAKSALGTAAPNPAVGCVIVHDDKIIGEGFTSSYGGPHAEVNAIEAVTDKSKLKKATLYCTLEPCSHFGKTPPCTDLILKHGISKVVIGIADPNTKVDGAKKLEAAGCTVISGVMEQECREHHRRFITFQVQHRPYIILKWAQTQDGFLAPKASERAREPQPYWITTIPSRQLVHKWRSEEQAVLVGSNTVLEDDPKLNVRSWAGSDPIKVILDKDLSVNTEHHVFDGGSETLVITENKDPEKQSSKATYETVAFSNNLASKVCELLHKHQITSVLIEGGAQTLETFIRANLWDEARIFTGSAVFKEGLKAPSLSGRRWTSQELGEDRLNIIRND